MLVAAKIVEYTNGLPVQIQRFPRIIDFDPGSLVDEEPSEAVLEVEEYHWGDISAAGWRVLGSS